MSETVYARSPDVVWRLGPDRVLVRRVGGRNDVVATEPLSAHKVIELVGPIALVWLALDDPADVTELVHRLTQADTEVVNLGGDLNRLTDAEIVERR